ncbi:HNH endonuclease signature motif containing protein [uncultured Serinicoccus sp.]|uniref:HNH endonuclease n=1 Tax=uncultured Serinicoccus sp. TaxID=735514 RepID=UPI0026081542|nr:HNH endonuclease signature motif containing protein [uncultured Serinicoccus sp.]
MFDMMDEATIEGVGDMATSVTSTKRPVEGDGPAGRAEIRALAGRLALPRPDASDAERLELIRALEDLNRASAAAHAVLSDEFDRSQRQQQEADGVAAANVGSGVADDLALAGKVSPARSSNRLACSRALAREMPRTLAALAEGVIDAHQAEVVTRATTCLSPADRRLVDEQLVGQLAGLSTRQLRATVTALVYELDPQAHVRRAARAAEDAYVSVRPAPDVMCVISAMLPAAQGVAVYAALKRHAELVRASGDERTQGRIMADTLYANVTGRDPVALPDIDLSLVMTDASLMAGDTVAAHLDGYGPLPAQTARDLLTPSPGRAADPPPATAPADTAGAPEPTTHRQAGGDVCPEGSRCPAWSCPLPHGATGSEGASPDRGASPTARGADLGVHPPAGPDAADVAAARVFVRRLYADPLTGEVFARDTRRRLFSEAQRALIVSRDRYCRTPWCGAPIRHIDHRVRHRDGGSTSIHNGQGLCQRCNQGRERPRQAAVPPTLYLRPGAVLPRTSPAAAEGRHPTAAEGRLPTAAAEGRRPTATTKGRHPRPAARTRGPAPP